MINNAFVNCDLELLTQKIITELYNDEPKKKSQALNLVKESITIFYNIESSKNFIDLCKERDEIEVYLDIYLNDIIKAISFVNENNTSFLLPIYYSKDIIDDIRNFSEDEIKDFIKSKKDIFKTYLLYYFTIYSENKNDNDIKNAIFEALPFLYLDYKKERTRFQ